MAASRKSTSLHGIMTGIHAEWVYKQMDDANNGTVDFKLDEAKGETLDVMRIRNFRNASLQAGVALRSTRTLKSQ